MFGAMTLPAGTPPALVPSQRETTSYWVWTGANPDAVEAQFYLGGALKEIKDLSGLSWQQIADALGVTRRSLHHWLNGSRINDAHTVRIGQLRNLVDEIAGMPPQEARSFLAAPDASGTSPLKRFALAGRVQGHRPGAADAYLDASHVVLPPPQTAQIK
jgi:transcriptional regulator with XRE-family HTH domain